MPRVLTPLALTLGLAAAAPLASAQGRRGDTGPDMSSEIHELRRQLGVLQSSLKERDEWFQGMRKDVTGLGEELSLLKERVVSPALPFLSGPPPSTDSVGVAKVAVFAPRVAVESSRRHDIVFLRVRRVEAGQVRPVAEAELGSDIFAVDLPLDQNGALYIVDWSTAEGFVFNLLLRDGSALRRDLPYGGDEAAGQPAASVQIKPQQYQGRFIFVGYRVD
jgi:hypothetical protein